MRKQKGSPLKMSRSETFFHKGKPTPLIPCVLFYLFLFSNAPITPSGSKLPPFSWWLSGVMVSRGFVTPWESKGRGNEFAEGPFNFFILEGLGWLL